MTRYVQVIQSITLDDLDVVLQTQDHAFSPPTSSNNTKAVYRNPFGFSLQVVESGQSITLVAGGVDAAQVSIRVRAVTYLYEVN